MGVCMVLAAINLFGSQIAFFNWLPLVWIQTNLGSSIWIFLLVLVLYVKDWFFALNELSLREASPNTQAIVELSGYQQKLSLYSSLFFGIGVLWTALGMRNGLVSSLGELDAMQASSIGAFGILERLVDGGILQALTTTVVGGGGGYLMRMATFTSISQPLNVLYQRVQNEERIELITCIKSIEGMMSTISGKNAKGLVYDQSKL